MNASEIECLLQRLRCSQIRVKTSWVEASCPLAPWLHEKGTDNHPSFGISIVPKGTSHYKCFGCGIKGDMLQFLWRLEKHTGKKFSDVFSYIRYSNSPSMKEYKDLLERASRSAPWSQRSGSKKISGIMVPERYIRKEPVIIKDSELDKFDKLPSFILNYLMSDSRISFGGESFDGRSLTLESLLEWEIGWHPAQKRISIPVRDADGHLVAISGRSWPPSKKPKYLHQAEWQRDLYLFGEDKVEKGEEAILVEGPIDVIKLRQLGYRNSLAMLGSYISKVQVEKLFTWFKAVRIVLDGDEAGRKGAEFSSKMLLPRILTSVVQVPEGMDPGDFTPEIAKNILGDPLSRDCWKTPPNMS